MISSIILLLVMWIKYSWEMPYSVWLKYMAVVVVECICYIVSLRQLDKWDLKTNYGRNRK